MVPYCSASTGLTDRRSHESRGGPVHSTGGRCVRDGRESGAASWSSTLVSLRVESEVSG